MSKARGKKKKDEVPVIPKYNPEHLIDSLNGKIAEEQKDINTLMDKLTKKSLDLYNQEKIFKEEANSVSKILDNNTESKLIFICIIDFIHIIVTIFALYMIIYCK